MDGGYALYKQLAAGADTYLDRDIVSQFHDKFRMTNKALRSVEKRLAEIKNCVKDMVDRYGVLESKCQLDVHRFPVSYLTCVALKKSEYPWKSHVCEVQCAVGEKKRKYKPGGNEIALLNLNLARKSKEVSTASMEGGDEGNSGVETDEEAKSGNDRGKRVRVT